MITLFKVLFLREHHEGVTHGKLSNAYKWQSLFKNR
ncbi:hypothetical protein J2X61_004870 [Bacillus sp. 3255]|nr:hypothetical protein [Bacillus sp. 3255]